MPCSDPAFRELSDHDVIWFVLQLVDEDRLHALAKRERTEILELALRLASGPVAINPDVPVVMRLRGWGLRCYARRTRRERESQRDTSERFHGCCST
jgi:hypothetical protein